MTLTSLPPRISGQARLSTGSVAILLLQPCTAALILLTSWETAMQEVRCPMVWMSMNCREP